MRILSIDIEWYVLVMLLAVFLVFSAASAADREQTDHNVSAQLYLEESMPELDSARCLTARPEFAKGLR